MLEAKLSCLAQEIDMEEPYRRGLERLMRLDECYEWGNNREK